MGGVFYPPSLLNQSFKYIPMEIKSVRKASASHGGNSVAYALSITSSFFPRDRATSRHNRFSLVIIMRLGNGIASRITGESLTLMFYFLAMIGVGNLVAAGRDVPSHVSTSVGRLNTNSSSRGTKTGWMDSGTGRTSCYSVNQRAAVHSPVRRFFRVRFGMINGRRSSNYGNPGERDIMWRCFYVSKFSN